MAGTAHLDLPQSAERQAGSLDNPLGSSVAYQEEASQLLASFVSARASGDSGLEMEMQCDIGAFVCHLAREVDAGELDVSVLDFYIAQFSEMAR